MPEGIEYVLVVQIPSLQVCEVSQIAIAATPR
jgi:hypothetical protein